MKSLKPGLLLPSATEVPRFKGKWVAPVALRNMVEVIDPYRIVTVTASPGSGKTRFLARACTHLETSLGLTCWLRLAPGTSGRGTLSQVAARIMGLTRCGGPRHRSSTRRPEIFGPSRYCLGIRR